MNHVVKFDPHSHIGLLKTFNSLEFEKGPTKVQKSRSNDLDFFFFANTLEFVRNRQLKCDQIAVLDLLNMNNDSDLNC